MAEALTLRKHLIAKVEQLKPLYLQGEKGLFELKTERVKVTDEVDEVKMQIPKVKLEEVTKEHDKYSKALRQLENKIQEANYTTEVDFDTTDLAI